MQPHAPPGPDAPWRSYRPSPAAIVTLVAAAVGFFCSLSSKTVVTIDGERSCTYFDFAPLLFAGVTVVAAVRTLVAAGRPPRQPVVEVAAGLLGVAVAAVHVLRAFGIIGSPC